MQPRDELPSSHLDLGISNLTPTPMFEQDKGTPIGDAILYNSIFPQTPPMLQFMQNKENAEWLDISCTIDS